MIFLKRNDPRRELNEIVNGARIIMQNKGNSGKWKLKAEDGKHKEAEMKREQKCK